MQCNHSTSSLQSSSDMTIIVEEKPIHVHKSILRIRYHTVMYLICHVTVTIHEDDSQKIKKKTKIPRVTDEGFAETDAEKRRKRRKLCILIQISQSPIGLLL